MQRKNSILNINPHKKRGTSLKKRAGFAMIMAIIVIIIISTIMALSLSLTAQTSKRTTDIYLYEQAALLSKSAAELTILEIGKNGCLDSFTPTFDTDTNTIFQATVSMKYIYTGTVGTCDDYFNITTPEQNGSVLMDVTVSVREDQNITSEPIRYFRRTIQKL